MPKTRTITIRGVPDRVLGSIRKHAESNRRSLNSEVLDILDRAALGSGEATPAATGRVRETPVAGYHAPPRTVGLKAVNRKALAAICGRFHVTWLAVFGSRARGDSTHDSDVDIVVDFEAGKTPGFGIVAMGDALSPLFGGARVDLHTRRGLSGEFADEVLRTAVTLHGDTRAR